jgi:hypothetical protein
MLNQILQVIGIGILKVGLKAVQVLKGSGTGFEK